MSADNGYVIRKVDGGYAAVQYFASDVEDYGYPNFDSRRHVVFPELKDAIQAAQSEYSEYGVHIAAEVFDE